MTKNPELTTREAFSKLISERNWKERAGLEKTAAAQMKRRFRQGGLTLDKIEEILKKSGFEVVHEKTWREV